MREGWEAFTDPPLQAPVSRVQSCPVGSTHCQSHESSSAEPTAGAADNPQQSFSSAHCLELSLFNFDDLQMGESMCYWFWNRALKRCRSLSFLTGDSSDKGFECSNTTCHSSVPAFMFCRIVVSHVYNGCSCVPVYFDGLKQVQRKSEAPEHTRV